MTVSSASVSSTTASSSIAELARTDRLRARLQGLLVVRLVVAIVLLGGMLFVVSDAGDYSGFTATALIALIVGAFASSAVFAAMLSVKLAARSLVPAQLAFDVLLATGFVYLSGAAASFFTILYGVNALAAAVVSTPRGVRITTACSILLYLLVGGGVALGTIPAPPDQAAAIYSLEGAQLGFVLLANLFGLSLVGGLAERLGTRLDIAGESLRQAESLNRDIVRSLTSGLLSIDAKGTIRSANPAAASMLRASEDELIGKTAAEVLPLGVAEAERAEGEAKPLVGDPFPVGFTTAPLVGEEGQLVLFTDLTEIRSLRTAAARAERLAVLGRLSSALAHEIRNPLGSISGSVQLVRDAAGLEEEDRELLAIVLREVDRLNGLVSQMLDVARPPTLRRAPADLVALCDEVVTVARGDEAFATLQLQVEGSAPDVPVDPDRIRQLLWNLFKNAAKASPPMGKITFKVDSDETHASLSVSDEGEGIDDVTNLFDMFYSGHDHGIGLGLAVVKQIVDSHDGHIRVEKSESGGACFVVSLPLRSSMRPEAI